MYEDAEKKGWLVEIVHLTNQKYFLSEISHTFHGRDIFAPVAAHLANGIPITNLGPLITDPIRLQMPKPEKTPDGWRAHITVIDIFGNLTTDLPADNILGIEKVTFKVQGSEAQGLVASYGTKQPGELVALVDSENYIEVAIVNGNAQKTLGARVGDVVEVFAT
jgi:S-adenosylmethionine hydrolase